MADNRVVDPHQAAERSVAVRTLLATPVLVADTDPDGFASVARHRAWLAEWFEDTCGWSLAVDVPGRFARLAKRASPPDHTRPARRSRGARLPFDRRRYELLARLCAELASNRVTTIGTLAGVLTPAGAGGLDTSQQKERAAFVDALRLLGAWGVVRFEAGDPDGFVHDRGGNALVIVDSGRVHRLLAPAVGPSRMAAPATTADAVAALVAEPRYGGAAASGTGRTGLDRAGAAAAPTATDADGRGDELDDAEGDGEGEDGPGTDRPGRERRLRRARHSLARRLLDDPAVHLDELDDEERAYLASSAGRRWLRDRVVEAGLVLEERAEGLVAVDPDGIATDQRFPAPNSTVRQAALLLVDRLVTGPVGSRTLEARPPADLAATVAGLLGRHPDWAREYQGDDGAARLAAAAVELLASLRLVVVDDDGTVRPRPALARYAVAPAEGALL